MPLPARDELGRFVAGLGEASDKLRTLSREVDESTRAQAEKAKEQREQAQQNRGSNLNAGLGVAGSALGAVGTTGDFADGLSSITQASIRAVRSFEFQGFQVGQVAAEVSGLNRAERILGTAAERTLDVTADIVRYGGQVSDEFRNETLRVFREQEERIERERVKVSNEAFSPSNIAGITKDQGARLLQAVEAIARVLGGGAAN